MARRNPDDGVDSAGPIVRIRGVGKRFPIRRPWSQTLLHPFSPEYQQALVGIDLDIQPGEFFGLLGQNGAGKTTLFKILATLVLPDEGTASVLGYDVEREAGTVRSLLTPVIANERSLYWRLSARDNLELYAALHGLSGREARKAIDRRLEVVGLHDVGAKQVGLFSSGMKQRLLIARALLAEPRILLLDEPTRSLDPITARDFREFLAEEIGKRQSCTVLLATHDREEVAELCGRVGVLDEGRLLAVGTPDELMRGMRIHRFRVWTKDPDHPAFAEPSLMLKATVANRYEAGPDGWTRLDLDIEEGADRAAEILHDLSTAGARISRFEREELPLADLIERAIDRDRLDRESPV